MSKPSLRTQAALELLTLAILTAAFLFLFPQRTTVAEMSLALFALALLAINARFTKNVVWAQYQPRGKKSNRLRICLMKTMAMTLSVVLVFLGIGIAIGYSQGGWQAALRRVSNWHILIAICIYFPWALLQQTLFQFYLLGRLRTLLPASVAVACTGVAYGLVHLPDLWDALATAAVGIFWTSLYYRYRLLSPLALSHALLGSTFYYWIYGRDLAEAWKRLLG